MYYQENVGFTYDIDGAEFLSYFLDFFLWNIFLVAIHTFLFFWFLFEFCGYLKSALFWNSHTKRTEPDMS